ncbi:MAG: hypothetical protein LC790_17390, partial [Actinobacteria bacterium]|nr:hypothetical protein [Actinomycetota bacterium]
MVNARGRRSPKRHPTAPAYASSAPDAAPNTRPTAVCLRQAAWAFFRSTKLPRITLLLELHLAPPESRELEPRVVRVATLA